ncbi:GGDEF domain-containing protein [Inhella gelatinilytica]|uniref:diguanylate cyclase n=1 Tax=Inhella gelatinilytica TaxID=2795030 RepID=A0A931NE52_9BURK|nr:GGDEF domain-containing protein [Inhella gelatinilytica]MBH9552141.1 diguanylate cyclase [Inhella gelatinilytica]
MPANASLHLPTVLLFAGLLTIVVTLGLGLLAWRDRSPYLWHWVAAMVCTCVGMVLFSLRGLLSVWLTVFVANLMLLGNVLFTLSGYDRLFGRLTPWRWMAALVAVNAAIYAWFTGWYDHFPTRVVTFNFTLAALSVAAAGVLWSERRRWPLALIALPLGAHGLQAVLGLTRVRLVLGGADTGPSLQAVSQPHAVVIMLNSFAALALVFGFSTLHAARLHRELDQQATTDVLTGLLNRRGFERALGREWRRNQRLQHGLAALMVDIDHFKAINDRYCHAAGDTALRLLAQALGQQLRPYDLLGRVGGEEFCVVLPGVTPELAVQTAERLCRAPVSFVPEGATQPLHLTVSIGVACSIPADRSPDALLRRADQALYRAKKLGRDQVVVAPTEA